MRHDYKRELPAEAEKIAKTLVAFANTYGGLMLVGVDQAPDGAPVLPACGLDGVPEQLASPPLPIGVRIMNARAQLS